MTKKNVVCTSAVLGGDMHVVIYGSKGLPIVVFPTQGQAPESLEETGVVDELADYLDSGIVQLFVAETIDSESWGSGASNEERAQRQEAYYTYVADELVPLVHKVSGSDARPLALGCDTGATQAAIVALRRPDLFQGCVCLSGCYDARRHFGDWMDATLYENTPCAFLPHMPADHPYVAVYNQRQLLFCTGQDETEADSLRSTRALGAELERLGVEAWCDYWGADVTHTWYWWKKQLRYFLPIVLADVEKTTAAEKPVKKRAPRKKAATTKAATKKPAAKKAAAEKDEPVAAETPTAEVVAEKPAAKKPAAKKTAAKRATTKKAAEKVEPVAAAEAPAAEAAPAEKKPAAKKTTTRRTAAKKTAAAKVEPEAAPAEAPAAEAVAEPAPAAKKPAARKTTARKTATKKPAAAEVVPTEAEAPAPAEKPAAKKPAAKKAAATTAAKKTTTAAKKPAARKTAASKAKPAPAEDAPAAE